MAEFKIGYEQGRADERAKTIEEFNEELKEIKHCLTLAKEQMLIDYVYIACEHLEKIEQMKGGGEDVEV